MYVIMVGPVPIGRAMCYYVPNGEFAPVTGPRAPTETSSTLYLETYTRRE